MNIDSMGLAFRSLVVTACVFFVSAPAVAMPAAPPEGVESCTGKSPGDACKGGWVFQGNGTLGGGKWTRTDTGTCVTAVSWPDGGVVSMLCTATALPTPAPSSAPSATPAPASKQGGCSVGAPGAASTLLLAVVAVACLRRRRAR